MDTTEWGGWLRVGAGSLRGACGAAELSPQLGNRLYKAGRCGAWGSGWFQGAHTCPEDQERSRQVPVCPRHWAASLH